LAFSATKAREDKDRATLSAQTYASDIVPKARGRAVSVIEGALAYKTRVVADAEGETSRFGALAAEYQRSARDSNFRTSDFVDDKFLARITLQF
jgi:membrane protease subunit HflK